MELHPAFQDVQVLRMEDRLRITAKLAMPPIKQGSQTGVAFDGSDSMQPLFGQAWNYSDRWDAAVLEQLIQEGKGAIVERDGDQYFEATEQGREELVELGFIVPSENQVEPVARQILPCMAERLCEHSQPAVVYWACGEDGAGVEPVGDLAPEQVAATAFTGPVQWGGATQLLPAVRYFVERFPAARWGFYVFITDGRIDDLEAVKRYTAEMSEKIYAGEVEAFHCTLVGVGPEVEAAQLLELTSLAETLHLPVHLWDHRQVATMAELPEAFAHLVEENAVVARRGRILDERGAAVENYMDGLPGLVRFTLPADAKAFTLDLPGLRCEQRLD